MDLKQFKLLVAAALVDGEIQEEEEDFLIHGAVSIGLQVETVLEEVQAMRDDPRGELKKLLKDLSRKQKIEGFQGAVRMVASDMDMNDKEKDFLRRLGLTLGFKPQEVRRLVALALR